jgi:hypothetical protein
MQGADKVGLTLSSFRSKVSRLGIKRLRCAYSRNSYNKFCTREAGWNTLRRNVPLMYLDAIGAELSEIEKAVEVDKEQYENVLKLSFFPKNAVIRVLARRL